MNDLGVGEEEYGLLCLQSSTLQKLLHVVSPLISSIPVC